MTIDEATNFFENIPAIHRKLKTIQEVGLGYIKLGQPATTFSGGEAQRIKLATELARASTGKTMYILDEPTTGLHNADVKRLLSILNRLVDAGNSMVIIEHNLDIVKSADWLIDMGPEGGAGGGTVVATGTPEQVSKVEKSWTGKYLKNILSHKKHCSSLIFYFSLLNIFYIYSILYSNTLYSINYTIFFILNFFKILK